MLLESNHIASTAGLCSSLVDDFMREPARLKTRFRSALPPHNSIMGAGDVLPTAKAESGRSIEWLSLTELLLSR